MASVACLLSLVAGVLLVTDIMHKLLLISPVPERLASVLLDVLLERLGERSAHPCLFLSAYSRIWGDDDNQFGDVVVGSVSDTTASL